MTISVEKEEFLGTYKVRDLGRDKGIHLPKRCSGSYDIYVGGDGTVALVPKKKGQVSGEDRNA
jgi:hypothetical protein